MAEFNEVDAKEVQNEVSVVRSEDAEDGNEETVVKIKLLEESVSLQVPVEERSVEDNDAEQVKAETGAAHVDPDEKGEAERLDKEAARKEKRRQRREKRREREGSKGSTSDENDLKQENSSQEKKAKLEIEEQQDISPKNSEKGGEPMQVQEETSLTVNLAGSPDGTEEAEVDVVQSERKQSAARELRALLEANMDGEACEPSEEDPEAERRAKEEREKRAEEVLASMNFENDQEADLQADDAPAREIVDEFFLAQEAKKDDFHLQLMLSSEDSDQGKTHHEEVTTPAGEEDNDAKLEELFSSENATDSREEEDNATEDGNPVEEVMVAHLQKETHAQPRVWLLADDGHELEVNGGKEEPVALSEKEKETKLKELFQEEVPKDDGPKEGESPEPRAPAEEAELTADSQLKVEAGVDLSVLDANKSAEPTQDAPNDDSLEGKEESSPDGANEEETEETEPFAEVQESVEEYVSVPDRKLDLCLEALSSGDELPTDESPAEEAQQSTEKELPKDLDSIFAFYTAPQTKKEDEDGREQQAVAVGEDVKEEEIREERKAADVECAWDMSFFDEPEKTEKPGAVEAGAEINEPLKAETNTTETISNETHVERFTESKTTYTTSILIQPGSPTLKKSASTLETSQSAPGEAVTRSTVTTTLETIMVTKVTAPDSPTGEQVVLRRNLKKEIEDAFEPLPDKESEGTAPLAQVEGTGLEGSEDDLLESAEEGAKSGNENEPLIEKAHKEEEPGNEDKKAKGEETEVEAKKPEARDEEELIPEEKKKKGRPTPKCCVLQ